MKKHLLILFCTLITITTLAQTPQAFNYQTVVRDTNGDVLTNQLVRFEIQLLEDSSTGTSAYLETHLVTTNAQGVVAFVIGQGDTLGDFTTIDWANHTYYMQVSFDETAGDFFNLLGTFQLFSVPYAINAKQSEDTTLTTTTNITSNEKGDYTTDDFVFGSPSLDDDGDVTHDNRFFFDKSKGAFRTGSTNSTQWDEANLGDYSFALGLANLASGESSMAWGQSNDATSFYATAWGVSTEATNIRATAWGSSTTASGNGATSWGSNTIASNSSTTVWGVNNTASGIGSTAWGNNNTATSNYETVFGAYSTNATGNASSWITTDRLFVVGNGIDDSNRSNALTISKDGTMNINDAYNLPIADGTAGQVLTTDGSGLVTWTSAIGDNLGNHTATTNIQTSNNWISNDGDAEGIYVDADGDVGIGITNPAHQFHVYGVGRSRFENSVNDRYFDINPGSATIDHYNGDFNINRFSDTDIILGLGGGNVGVGNTMNPIYQLDVTGTGRFTDALRIGDYTLPTIDGTSGQILTTNGTGTVSWADNSTPVFTTSATITSNSNGNYVSDDFVFGSSSLDDTGNSDYDERFFFDKSRGAFRAGSATSDQWDATNRGFFSVAMGDRTIASGNLAVALGGQSVATGFNSVAIGAAAEAEQARSIAIGSNVVSYSQYEVVLGRHNTVYVPNNAAGWDTSDRLFVIGNGTANNSKSDAMVILKNGNVGLQTDSPSYALQVGTSGDGTQARANAWNTFSDRRWKTDFQVIQNAIEKIQAINGYYYKWKNKPDATIQVGVIAQEIEAVLPEVVSTDDNGYKSVDYSKLTALLIEGMKAQQKELNEFKKELTKVVLLEKQNKALEKRLIAIEKLLKNK